MANPIPLVANDAEDAPKGAIPVDLYGVESGGSAVESVNGQSGAVVLGAGDVGALPASTPIPTEPQDIGAQPAGSYATQSALNDLIQRVEALENASDGLPE